MKQNGWIPPTPKEIDDVNNLLGSIQGGVYWTEVAPHLRGNGRGKLLTPYKSASKLLPGCFEDEAQATGDCTSHGVRNVCEISRCVEIDIKGEAESVTKRLATEPIYGARGSNSYGMSVALAVQNAVKYGVIERAKYSFADLSVYNAVIGINWGSRGLPADVVAELKKHPMRYWARIQTIDDIFDAMDSGYAVVHGSQYGNNGVRDAKGYSRRNGSWNHCHIYGAITPEGDCLDINSWGIWNRGGMPDWGPIPGGSWVSPEKDVQWVLDTGEVFVVGDFNGYPARELPDYGNSSFLN